MPANYQSLARGLQSGRGQPQSKTLPRSPLRQKTLSVLDCGCPLPLWLLGLVAFWLPFGAFGQASLQTLLSNGPTSNRFNVAFLSEGYTAAQLPQFLRDATNALNALFAHQPYTEYRSYFNASAISVASPQSGSDHPVWPSYVMTYFNSAYDMSSDRLITIPPNSFDPNYSNGQGKVDALLLTFMPNCQLSVLLVNDQTDGGSDGFDKTAIASAGFQMPEILTHETGHVIANLGDEYTTPYPGYPDTEEPNTTRETNRASIKWNAWISPSTPLPTPPTGGYASVVGLFQGAHYHTDGWYRPKLDCLMKGLYVPFCDVCSETLVLALYRKVRPIEAYAPANTNYTVSTNLAQAFSVTLLQPTTHNLSVQWVTNGVLVPGATNSSFTVMPVALGNGVQAVSASVVDPTPLVRNDPTNLLHQTVAWTLNVNVPQLHLDSPLWLSGGKFAFRVSGNASQGVVTLVSTNCVNWTPLATNTLSNGQFWLTNSGAGAFPKRYFRAKTPP